MSRSYCLFTTLGDEDVVVWVRVGDREPPGSPFAGYRDLDIIEIKTCDGRDLSDQEKALDWGALEDQVAELERQEWEAAEAQDEDLWRDR